MDLGAMSEALVCAICASCMREAKLSKREHDPLNFWPAAGIYQLMG